MSKKDLIELFRDYVQYYMFTKLDFDVLYSFYVDGYLFDYFLNHNISTNKDYIQRIDITMDDIIEFSYGDWL